MNDRDLSPIDQRWLQQYCDKLLEVAQALPPGTMREMTFLRVEHAMDIIEAWQKRNWLPEER